MTAPTHPHHHPRHPFTLFALGGALAAIGIALLPIPLAMHPDAPLAIASGACLSAGGIAMFRAAGAFSSRRTPQPQGDTHAH